MILQLMDGKGGFIGVPHIYEAEGESCGASNSGGSCRTGTAVCGDRVQWMMLRMGSESTMHSDRVHGMG